jgi:lantibiotic biosynthesis protein
LARLCSKEFASVNQEKRQERPVASPTSAAKQPVNSSSTPEFRAAGFFVMRAPLLPLAEFLNWGALSTAAAAPSDEAQAQALTADRAALRERLRALVAQPAIREALFVASPDMEEYLEHWLRAPRLLSGARVEGALVRYFARMCSRATPFGLFAATSLGQVGATTDLYVAARQHCERHTRLDMDYLFALVNELVKDPALRRALRYQPNSSLYYAADRVRYVEARLRDKQRSYHLVAVDLTGYLDATLQRAAKGATFGKLAAALVDDEITPIEAEAFIEKLIESQLLVPTLALPVTGAEPIHPIITKLHELAASVEDTAAPVAAALVATRAALAALDAAGLGATPEQYRAVAEGLAALPAKVELPRLFQVDMVRPANQATLGEAVVSEISAGVELLRNLFGKPYESEISRFAQAFSARYEEREVPLAKVLDEDLGIGFPVGAKANGNAPLLNGLVLGGGGEPSGAWRARDSYLLDKLTAVWAADAAELRLTDKDVEALKVKEALPWTNSFAAMCKVAADSPVALANGDFQVLLENAGGSTGANLLGRFCHADAALQDAVEQLLRAEEAHQPDAVFAEIAHLPEGRVGNVLARPLLRAYEIPYLGISGANTERQLPVADLLVSVRGGRVVLRSKRLGCEVIPRLTNAHNYAYERAVVYKFLCALQTQGQLPGVGWEWGALESAPFLPRVTYGRLVLAPARWLVSQNELKTLSEAPNRFQAAQRWRAARKLPRYVVLADGDNTLPVDLDNALSVDAFVHIVKERTGVTLRELWPAPNQLAARGPEGVFTHELIVPFVRIADSKTERSTSTLTTTNPSTTNLQSAIRNPQSLARRFAPGSEWLYAKLYCGAATADQVLREAVLPSAREIMAAGGAEQWFFIRYGDPEHHLRVRFQGDPARLLTEVWPRLQASLTPLLADGRVWRVQLDTYEREVERYGGPVGVDLAEQLFYADSVAVSEIIGRLSTGAVGMDERWRLALAGLDRLLGDLGFDLPTKLAAVRQGRAGFLKEFHADDHLHSQLSERYRNERKSLEQLLALAAGEPHALAPGLAILVQRSQQLAPIVAKLKAAERAGQLTVPLTELVLSYLHMHVNRLLRSSQRAQEMVLYDLLTRLYSARLARQKPVAQAIAA